MHPQIKTLYFGIAHVEPGESICPRNDTSGFLTQHNTINYHDNQLILVFTNNKYVSHFKMKK